MRLGLNYAASGVPTAMECKNCDANYYSSSNTKCTACSANAMSTALLQVQAVSVTANVIILPWIGEDLLVNLYEIVQQDYNIFFIFSIITQKSA